MRSKPIPHTLYPIPLVVLILLLAVSAFAGPVSHFGALKACKVSGKGQLCGSKNGMENTAVWVKGPSLFWSVGDGAAFYSPETVNWFVDNMKIGVIRAAMGIEFNKENSEPFKDPSKPSGQWPSPLGYVDNAAGQKALIKSIVDAAIFNDIYVIVDWHSHNAHTEKETALAKTFFGEMATEYKDVPNIIWEVYNEPQNASAKDITDYANEVISVIRNAGNNNLVIVGSRQWSKEPSSQASNWGSSDNAVSKNVAFTFHFYAADGAHALNGGIGTSANAARDNGYAVFGSEWGFTNSDGGGNTVAGTDWTTWMDNNKVSNCNWSASAQNEASAMFTTGTSVSNLSTTRLKTSGQNFQSYMSKANSNWIDQRGGTHPKANDVNASVNDGASITLSSQLGLDGDITEISAPDFGEATISADKKSIVYKTSDRGSPSDKVRFIYKVTKNSITIQNRVIININNRRPELPEKAPVAVSRKAATTLEMNDLLVKNGTGFTAASVSPTNVGTVSVSGGKIIFTPSASQHSIEYAEATLSYTAQNSNGNSSATVVLQVKNFPPTIRSITTTFSPDVPNTAPVEIGLDRFSAADKDGDDMSFAKIYLDSRYPGELKEEGGKYVYYPDANRTGQVAFLAVITDGTADSPVGRANITLTGNGTAINVTAPTEIPGYVEPPTPIIFANNADGVLGLKSLGLGKIEISLAQNGYAKLDVFSLSGKSMGTLLNGHQSAGSKEISLKSLNLQKGVYILRLKQGSQVKVLRVVN